MSIRRNHWAVPASVAAAGTLLFSGCEADAMVGVETRPASDEVKEQIARHAMAGLWVAPYEVAIEVDRVAERSFAKPEGLGVNCSNVGEQLRVSIDMLYALDEQGQLQQFAPPGSISSSADLDTAHCVSFNPADGDVINLNGVPEVGVFGSGSKSFVIGPEDGN